MPEPFDASKLYRWDDQGRLLCPVCGRIMAVAKARNGREYASHCGCSVTCSDEDIAALKRSSPSSA